jgi:hypothetical protein
MIIKHQINTRIYFEIFVSALMRPEQHCKSSFRRFVFDDAQGFSRLRR